MTRLVIGLLLIGLLFFIYRCKGISPKSDIKDTNTDTSSISDSVGTVLVLEKEFDIPELNRKRKVWLYLPPNYKTSSKRYPVLYMQDGQNLFDASASFAGEWKIDETINTFHKDNLNTAIVVGIENSKDDARLDEYSPWQNEKYKKGGEGEAYVNFIVNDLKPYIDENYRTSSDQSNTAIGGSSMGGLISMYAIMEHQDVFGKALIFSPSFWFSEEAYTHVEAKEKQTNLKIYFAAGAKEEGDIPANTERMRVSLKKIGFTDEEITIQIDEDGFHGEGYWAKAFQPAYRWLFID